MDIQNRLYMAFIGVDEPPIQPFLCLHEGQSRLLDFALFLSQNTFVAVFVLVPIMHGYWNELELRNSCAFLLTTQ